MIGQARRMARPSISAHTDRPTVTDGLVAVRGRRLRVQVRRPQAPSGPPLLLLNGIGATLDLLDPFADALPADREIIRLDPPGIGGSPGLLLPHHLTTLPPVVGDLAAQLGHDRVDVLGYSWGGELAQQLAFCRPAQVRRLVLFATSTGALSVPASPRVLSRFFLPRWPQDPTAALAVAADLYGGTGRTHPERAAAALTEDAEGLGRHPGGYSPPPGATRRGTEPPRA